MSQIQFKNSLKTHTNAFLKYGGELYGDYYYYLNLRGNW